MARVPLHDRAELSRDDQQIFDVIANSRSGKVGNVWKALLNAPLLAQKALEFADALRHQTTIDPCTRELAVMMVGLTAECPYEYDHHWNAARKLGISSERLTHLADFETSALYTPRERAVLRFARESTKQGHLAETTWQALKQYLNDRQAVELAIIVAWYNAVVRMLLSMDVENEPGFQRED